MANGRVPISLGCLPPDFALQFGREKFDGLMSQFAIPNVGQVGRRGLAYVLTEHGAVMVAGFLNSEQVIGRSVLYWRGDPDPYNGNRSPCKRGRKPIMQQRLYIETSVVSYL
jgi:hypothetical protein